MGGGWGGQWKKMKKTRFLTIIKGKLDQTY